MRYLQINGVPYEIKNIYGLDQGKGGEAEGLVDGEPGEGLPDDNG